jgi:hypothetical protein
MPSFDQEVGRRHRVCRRTHDGSVVTRRNDQLRSGKTLEQPADNLEFADVGQVFSHERRIASSLRAGMLALDTPERP